jgi:hypothetical protein
MTVCMKVVRRPRSSKSSNLQMSPLGYEYIDTYDDKRKEFVTLECMTHM